MPDTSVYWVPGAEEMKYPASCSVHRDQRSVAIIHGIRPTGYGSTALYSRNACKRCAAKAEAKIEERKREEQ